MNKRGIALYVVLATILIVIIFANIVLTLISSQSKLTQHQIRRIQAYYAAQAGINYALEALRNNDNNWVNAGGHIMCRGITGTAPCTLANYTAPTSNLTETDLPRNINYVLITVSPVNPADGSRVVSATANYTSD